MAEDRSPETFIFSFVRMNPPTPGHLELVKTLIYKAIELNAKRIYILLSTTVDDKNPIRCEGDHASALSDPESLVYKKTILSEMIKTYIHHLVQEETNADNIPKLQQLNIIVRCAYGNPFGTIHAILSEEFASVDTINMFVVVGRDRANFLDNIADQFIVQDKINSVDGLILERPGMDTLLERPDILDIPISDIPKDALSASYVRKLVKLGQIEKFRELYMPYLSPPNIEIVYESIRRGLKPTDPVPLQAEVTGTPTPRPGNAPDPIEPQSKYFEKEHIPLVYTPEQKRLERERRAEEKTKRDEKRSEKASKKTKNGGKRTRKYKKNKRKSRRF
jgi:hypothetical protein